MLHQPSSQKWRGLPMQRFPRLFRAAPKVSFFMSWATVNGTFPDFRLLLERIVPEHGVMEDYNPTLFPHVRRPHRRPNQP